MTSLLEQMLQIPKDTSAKLKKMQQTCDSIVSKAITKSMSLKLISEHVKVIKNLEPHTQMEHDEYVEMSKYGAC